MKTQTLGKTFLRFINDKTLWGDGRSDSLPHIVNEVIKVNNRRWDDSLFDVDPDKQVSIISGDIIINNKREFSLIEFFECWRVSKPLPKRKSLGKTITKECQVCRKPFPARLADINRGWAKTCSKTCAKRI
jgi:hypothetical protein